MKKDSRIEASGTVDHQVEKTPKKPIEVCSRRERNKIRSLFTPDQVQTKAKDLNSSSTVPIADDTDLDLPFALRKGKRSFVTHHPIQNLVSYHHFSPKYRAFVSSLSAEHIPSYAGEALRNPK